MLRRRCDLWRCFSPPQSRWSAVNARYSWCRAEISRGETTSRTPLVEATRRDLDQTVRQAALCGTPVHFGKALQARHRRTNKEGSFRVGRSEEHTSELQSLTNL